MDINRARQLAGDMKKLETGSSARLKPGVITVLFNKVEEFIKRDTKAPMLRAAATVIIPKEDEFGRGPQDTDYEGHYKGEEVSWVYSFNDYFNKEFGPFLIAGLGLSSGDASAMGEDEILETFASVVRENGSADRGIFDGCVALELTIRRGAAKKEVVDGKETGKMRPGFVSIRQYRNVPLSDLAESLSDEDIVRYFGSVDAYAELIAND